MDSKQQRELFNTSTYVFLSRLTIAANPNAVDRLKTVKENIIWDESRKGAWIKRGSTAHSLAIVLGLEPYDIKLRHQDGVYDKTGRIR